MYFLTSVILASLPHCDMSRSMLGYVFNLDRTFHKYLSVYGKKNKLKFFHKLKKSLIHFFKCLDNKFI